ncbi:MAG: sugar transferase [Bacteroidetes bacterium]|nr:MAG: sugar transferase [Bacteroidota bacterium]
MEISARSYLLGLLDWVTATGSWAFFFYFRKVNIEQTEFVATESFYWGVFLIPICWVVLYTIQGTYIDVRRLYRIKTLNLTVQATLIGSLILFFALLLDDSIQGYQMYYKSFFALFVIHFTFTFVPRIVWTVMQVYRIQQRKEGFRTLLLGGSDKAVSIYKEISQMKKSIGNEFVGFVNLNGIDRLLENEIQYLGHVTDLEKILNEQQVEEVIIALESTEHERLKSLIARISTRNIKIKILPDMYDILSGSVRLNNIFGALLIEVNTSRMPVWQFITKRLIDIAVSAVSLIFLFPVYCGLALAVKLSSKGPVFFLQERIGKNGRRFQIIKFRTMYVGSEKNGPQLSSADDPRITKVGRFLRKTRLDEFPQFWNVLIGDMSLVGPRPERQYYIDQIVAIEPQFLELNSVRPGITSWGQVKYGYAENVEQMLQRMKYDLLYLKNMSLALDLKIMLYTILIIFKGTGK